MTTYAIVDPATRTIKPVEALDYKDALTAAGLQSGGIDFGTVAFWNNGDSLSIMVYEYGLLKPKNDQYWSMNKQLFNGAAVLFRANSESETIDISRDLIAHWNDNCADLQWFKTPADVETAIAEGKVIRPATTINGETVWEWKGAAQ